jgi:hypothetical protein
MQFTKKIVIGTLLSILTFFAVSFITVLFQLNSPINPTMDSSMSIGFPFNYYHQFMVSPPTFNSSWNPTNLLLDCFITWLLVVGIYIFFTKNK